VCGGGRYDGLFAQIGGKPAPATGFAMGNERLIALLRETGGAAATRTPDAYLLSQGDGTQEYALTLAETLRAAGYSIIQHAGGGSFKSQMRKADASGAWTALIVGADEVRDREVSVKFLRKTEAQYRIGRADAVTAFAQALQRART